MKVSKYIYVMFMLLTFNVLGCSNEKPEEKAPQKSQDSSVNDDRAKAPGFTLVSTTGEKVSLSDYLGKIVVLDFWATWCGPCRMGVPDLVSIQNKYKDKLVVIGISLDSEPTIKNVIPFMEEYSVNYPVVYGTNEVVIDYGYIQAIPTTFIIDEEGNVADSFMGLIPKAELEKKIKSVIKGS